MPLRSLTAWFVDGRSARQVTTRAVWAVVVALAELQHGVVARRQLEARGIPESQIDEWVKAGMLHVRHRGVYSVGHRLLGAHGRRLAAVLACGDDAGLYGQTAADLLGIRPSASGVVHVWVPNQRGRRVPGICPHRDADVLPEDFVVVEGIRTTSAMRVLVDMAPRWSVDALEKAFGRTEVNRQFDLHALYAIIARRPNRPGIGKLRHVMEIYDGPVPDMTALEERGLWLVRTAGLPEPRVQVHVGPHRVDFFWPDRLLIMEMDSVRWHLAVQRWQHDQDRTNDHLAEGIATTRVSWERALQPATVERLRRIHRTRPVVT